MSKRLFQKGCYTVTSISFDTDVTVGLVSDLVAGLV